MLVRSNAIFIKGVPFPPQRRVSIAIFRYTPLRRITRVGLLPHIISDASTVDPLDPSQAFEVPPSLDSSLDSLVADLSDLDIAKAETQTGDQSTDNVDIKADCNAQSPSELLQSDVPPSS